MVVVSNGCKLGGGDGFDRPLTCSQINEISLKDGSDAGVETDEIIAASSISSASSIDLEEFVDDSSDTVEAVKLLLQCLGEDIQRAGLLKTPLRVARAFAFATKGYRQSAKDIIGDALFPEAGVESGSGFAGGLGGMVIVRNINQYSLCGSCLLPFKVCCHIAYISSGYQVVGLSKLARVTDMFARRLQNPQTLTDEICEGLSDIIKPIGVAVALQSWHLPVPGSHNDAYGAKHTFQQPIITYAGRGRFENKHSGPWEYFLALLQLEGIAIPYNGSAECNVTRKEWCPCAGLDTYPVEKDQLLSSNGHSMSADSGPQCSNKRMLNGTHLSGSVPRNSVESFSVMVSAVESILSSLIRGIVKEDLHPAAICYTKWLSYFKRGCQESWNGGSMDGVDNGMNGGSTWMHKASNGHTLSRVISNGDSPLSHMEDGLSSFILTHFDAPFCSLCEHHLLPFYGRAHIGYLSSDAGFKDVNRNSVLEIVKSLGHKLQVQERLTREIAEALAHRFCLSSIIVVLEASHVCMLSRGVEKVGSSTATDAVIGHFATNYSAKARFLGMIVRNREAKRTCPGL
ncbi:hypothetical protein KP509_34G044100 [Ceratopteris richardii]|nr:hypothetical protein KP509_34G044100 [Ceratopteris richardii]